MPAAISEGFFLSSEYEYNEIQTNARLGQEAEALFTAVTNYLD